MEFSLSLVKSGCSLGGLLHLDLVLGLILVEGADLGESHAIVDALRVLGSPVFRLEAILHEIREELLVVIVGRPESALRRVPVFLRAVELELRLRVLEPVLKEVVV